MYGLPPPNLLHRYKITFVYITDIILRFVAKSKLSQHYMEKGGGRTVHIGLETFPQHAILNNNTLFAYFFFFF